MKFNCPDQTWVQRDGDAALPYLLEAGHDSYCFPSVNTICNKVLSNHYLADQ